MESWRNDRLLITRHMKEGKKKKKGREKRGSDLATRMLPCVNDLRLM